MSLDKENNKGNTTAIDALFLAPKQVHSAVARTVATYTAKPVRSVFRDALPLLHAPFTFAAVRSLRIRPHVGSRSWASCMLAMSAKGGGGDPFIFLEKRILDLTPPYDFRGGAHF